MISHNSFSKKLLRYKYSNIWTSGFLQDYLAYKKGLKDPLTGVATLSYIINEGNKMLECCSDITILVIGIDDFKLFNDSYGHLTSNNILIKFGEMLIHKTTNQNCMVGRLGGDEFLVLIENNENFNHDDLIDVLRAAKDELYKFDKNIEPIKINFSIGHASSIHKSTLNIQKLIQNAESNMVFEKFQNRKSILEIDIKFDIYQDQSTQLLKVLAEKDMYTYVHSQYVAKYAVALAEALSLPSDIIQDIYLAGWLHDIGKIVVSSDILRKPIKLEQDEYFIIKQHVINGLNIISIYDFPNAVKNAIQFHHERWDGRGYPKGVLGNDTPIEGRILQITDAFSAMTIKRVYRDQLSIENVIKELSLHSGTQFDPEILNIFIELLKEKKVEI